MNVFDKAVTGHLFAPSTNDWMPPEFPLIASAGIREVALDFETTGLRWFEKHRPIGVGLCLPTDTQLGYATCYLPIRHNVGPNLPVETYREWANRELRGVHITNANTRFDIHMAREDGVDFEALGCPVSDIMHYAALLDDHRLQMSQESIVRDYLPEEQKVKIVDGVKLNMNRAADYHPGVMSVRAEGDVRQVHLLSKIMLPLLEQQDLMRVKALEDRVIYVVCEMEKNGAHIDIAKLEQWNQETAKRLDELQLELSRMLNRRTQAMLFDGGRQTEYLNPDSSNEMEKLFRDLGLPIVRTETGRPSFTSDILKGIKHPAIQLLLRISKLLDLRSKYIVPYMKNVDRSTGILRYALHQMRAQKDPLDEFSKAGTISGRFSSTKLVEDDEGAVGLNIQQIMKPSKQVAAYGEDFIIRELHIPISGHLGLSSDAMQIEYRGFASYTNARRLIDVYLDNPLESFHKSTHKMLSPYVKLSYKGQKDLNFAKLYGAGLRKMAVMMGEITGEEYRQLLDIDDHKVWMSDPRMQTTLEINRIYNREIPEAKVLLDKAKRLAEERGYVCTILGRRSRFPGGKRSHKALNAVIQGSAADIMKQKLVELHDARQETGFILRFTVHDEVDGDAPSTRAAQKVSEVLNRQSFPLKVPILWETNTGPNWYHLTETYCPLCQTQRPSEPEDAICVCRRKQ